MWIMSLLSAMIQKMAEKFCRPYWNNKAALPYLHPEKITDMGVTRLKRKDRRNKAVANARVKRIKQLTLTPVIKKVDVEELKKSFSA